MRGEGALMDMIRVLVAIAASIPVLAGYAWVFEKIVTPMPDNWLTETAVLVLGLGALVLPGAVFWFVLVKLQPKGRHHGL